MTKKLNTGLKQTRPSSESGFMMMVIPVFLLLFSFFVSAMLKETKPNEFYVETEVQHTMQDVRVALAAYAHAHYRIPCPAAPGTTTGAESWDNVNSKCISNAGVLPYRELGLPEIAAKDKWGHFYTYKVSPDFTRKINDADYDRIGGLDGLPVPKDKIQNFVHKICQTPNWLAENQTDFIDTDGGNKSIGSTININKNIYKAHFCCPANVVGDIDGGSSTFIDTALYKDKANGEKQSHMDLKPNGPDGEGEDAIRFSFEAKETADEYLALMKDAPNFAEAKAFHQQTEDYYLDPKYLDMGFSEFKESDGTDASTGYGLGHAKVHGGKTWDVGAVLEFVDPKIQTDHFTMSLTDVNHNDLNAPVQLYMDMVAPDGTVFEKVSYIVQMPDVTEGGQLDLTLKVTDILGNADQPHLVNRDGFGMPWGLVDPDWESKGDEYWELKRYPLQAATAKAYFNDQQAKFLTELAAKGFTPEDVANFKIKKLKFDTTYCSLGFKGVSYTSPSDPPTSNNTDLRVFNEANTEILNPRNNASSYGLPDEKHPIGEKLPQDFEAVAYALISHGANGEGAYQADGTPIDNIDDTLQSPFEKDNFGTTNFVRDMRKISADLPLNQYDDIVMWDSQLTLYNSLRNGTCESAQAL